MPISQQNAREGAESNRSSAKGGSVVVDFFIVGAMKSGTSSLRDLLKAHPSIDIYRGEIHFFDNDKLYDRGNDWYHAHFTASGPDILYGDKSPSYSLDRRAAGRIQRYNPNAKIVWILRNPVKRTISNYFHALKRKPDSLDIEQAIERADELEAVNSPHAYIYRSQYEKHLGRYLETFGAEQNFILILEEVLKDPLTHMESLLAWLDAPPLGAAEFPHSNVGKKRIKQSVDIPAGLEDRLYNILEPTTLAVEGLLGRKIAAWRP